MRAIPALDLMRGVVVRGVGGRRAEYQPVAGTLTESAEPAAVAQALADRFGLRELYLADLDAIAGATPALGCYADLRRQGIRLWVDAGVRDEADAGRLIGQVDGVVAGLETLAGPEALARIVRLAGPARIVFSLDMKAGRPLGDARQWPGDPLAIAARALAAGVGKVLVLDLAQVGTGAGIGSEALCRELKQRHPDVELWAGGGVRDGRDLARLQAIGVEAVLLASALHDGRIEARELNAENGPL